MQRRSTINTEVINTVDPGGGAGWQSTQRINSQLSLFLEKAITSVDPGGQVNDQHGEISRTFTWKNDHLYWSWGVGQWLIWRESTVNFHFHMKRWSPLLILGGWGILMIDMEKINSQLSHEKAITSVDSGGVGIDAPRDIPSVARVGH